VSHNSRSKLVEKLGYCSCKWASPSLYHDCCLNKDCGKVIKTPYEKLDEAYTEIKRLRDIITLLTPEETVSHTGSEIELSSPLSNIQLPLHTKECNSFMLGGVAMGSDTPNNRKVWKCSNNCPLKQKEAK
jgi:hypothetical protein